jgi:hypothetical protein
MPSQREHAFQVLHNREFLATFDLDNSPFLDWAVTVVFYTAVHLVEQFLAHKGQDLLSHETRERFISQSADLKPIWSVYRELKYQSERARYLVARFQPDEVRKMEEKLRQVEAHIQGLLG